MKAKDVPIGTWFMVKRTKQWYKRLEDEKNKDYVIGGRIETPKPFYIDKDEEVLLDK